MIQSIESLEIRQFLSAGIVTPATLIADRDAIAAAGTSVLTVANTFSTVMTTDDRAIPTALLADPHPNTTFLKKWKTLDSTNGTNREADVLDLVNNSQKLARTGASDGTALLRHFSKMLAATVADDAKSLRKANQLNGQIVFLTYTGAIDVKGAFSGGFNLSGKLDGAVRASKSCNWDMTAKGFGVPCHFSVEFNGPIKASIQNLDVSGEFGLHVNISGGGDAMLFGESILHLELSATADLIASVVKQGNSVVVHVEGPVGFTTPFGTLTTSFSNTFGG